jgi:hypothetical protein
MSKQALTPSVYRPALGLEGLRPAFEDHLHNVGEFEGPLVDRVLWPLHRPHAPIITYNEIERLRAKLGIAAEDEERITELRAAIQTGLPKTQFDAVVVDTRILTAIPSERVTRKMLTVGQRNRTMSRERQTGQNVICAFYGLDERPRGVWFPDRQFGRVAIMANRNRKTTEIYNHLRALLTQRNSPLPATITLAPVRIDADLAQPPRG